MKSTKETKQRVNRIINDLAEANFDTPDGLEFIRYGRRADADYKISKHPETEMHFIEVRRGEDYQTKWIPTWEASVRHLAYLCSKFKNKNSSMIKGEN